MEFNVQEFKVQRRSSHSNRWQSGEAEMARLSELNRRSECTKNLAAAAGSLKSSTTVGLVAPD
jgi:hypothetical protein